MVRTLTLEDRKIVERMWADNCKSVQIAAKLGISQCTVYTELKRGRERDKQTGQEIIDSQRSFVKSHGERQLHRHAVFRKASVLRPQTGEALKT